MKFGIAFSTVACVAAAINGAAPPSAVDEHVLEVRARAVRQGEPLLLVLLPSRPVLSAEGQWLGRKIRFGRLGGRLVAWAPIGRDAEPGDRQLKIILRFPDGTVETVVRGYNVAAADFARQQLSVDPRFVTLSKEDLERVRQDNAAAAKAYASSASELLWSGPFIPPAEGRWSSPFGAGRFFNNEERSYHSGADIAVPEGTAVCACNDGRVALVRDTFFGGKTVLIDHGLGTFTGYMHLSEFKVRPGQAVKKGQVIGLSGATGRVTGPHLHWMLQIAGIKCDPTALLEIRTD